jgi:DNA-binding NtrC family response regulator
MAPSLPVLIGLDDATAAGAAVRSRLERAIRSYGLASCFCRDGREALALARETPLAATLVDAEWALDEGELVWRVAVRHLRQRLVLMTHEARRDLWFEALQQGAAAVLPLPPAAGSVRLALDAALRRHQGAASLQEDYRSRDRRDRDEFEQDFNWGAGTPSPRRW